MSARKHFKTAVTGLAAALLAALPAAADFAEGNAAAWGSFVPDWEGVTSSVSDATDNLRTGNYSLRFDTGSGFDTGVKFPKEPTADWDLGTNTHLVFWSRGENANDFQDNRPLIVLNSPSGSFRYEPDYNLTLNHQWAFIKVPLAGDVHWTRTAEGSPTLAHVTQLEIHEDTWDSGFTIYYDGVEFVSLNPGGPPPGPPAPAGVDPDAIRQRVLLYIQDPIMENKDGQRMHQAYGWAAPQELTQGVLRDFADSSHGRYLPQIIETRVADEYPWLLDGFRYDDASYDDAINSGIWHESGFDYWRFLTENGIADRIESGDVDEVWVYNSPGSGMWESTMAGAGGYWCNSSPVDGATNSRVAVVMGWNFERGVGEAIHSFGHRTESVLWKIYDYVWEPSRINAWSAFALPDRNAPGLGGVGNVHYPVNGESDYDYANPNTVASAADDWTNYPNFLGLTRSFDFHEWSPDETDPQRDYLNWWYAHLPHFPGKAPAPDDRLNNWWRYVIDIEQFKGGNGTLADASGLGSARIVQPADGTAVSGTVAVAVDAGVDGALGRVDLYVDGIYYASDTLAPFRFAWDPGGLLGTHTLTAKAYELQSGAETVSVPVDVTVQSGTMGGFVRSNSVPLAGVHIAATGTLRRWLRQTVSPAAAIPDNSFGGVTNTLTIAATGTLVDANVGVTIRHPRADDLEVTLVHPGGAAVRLCPAGGGTGTDLITLYPELTAPKESFATLAGLPIQGDWRLVVRDLADGGTGQLESWSLALDYLEPATFFATTGATGAYALTNLPAGDYQLRPAKAGHTFLPIVADITVQADTQAVDFATGPNLPPTLSSPPTNQTVYAGSTVAFFAGVTGTGPFHYEWFFNGEPISNSDEPSLVLPNVLVDHSGIYSVVVSNPMPASATASAVLTVLPMPMPDDFCEGNATNWLAFRPDDEPVSVSVIDSTEHVKSGTQSMRFDTGSGFETGVMFPANGDGHWDLRGIAWLSFWTWAENNTTYGFQGDQPIVVLNCAGGSLRYTPNQQLVNNHAWTFYRIPLMGNAVWQIETEGAPSLADANQIEIHHDTWGYGFILWYDALRFEAVPWFDPPVPTNNLLRLRLHAPDNMPFVLLTSTNLAAWTPVATNSAASGTIEWLPAAETAQRFFRAENQEP